jgi:hypothetical protein
MLPQLLLSVRQLRLHLLVCCCWCCLMMVSYRTCLLETLLPELSSVPGSHTLQLLACTVPGTGSAARQTQHLLPLLQK